MKQIFCLAAIAAAVISMASCSSRNCQGKSGDRDEVYTGVVPAADCAGVRYTLALDFDDDNNYTDGDYKLVQTYLVADSTASLNYKDADSYKEKGDFTVAEKGGKKLIKLIPDPRHGGGQPLYFLIDNDSTLTMTNAEMDAPVDASLNYTLRKVK